MHTILFVLGALVTGFGALSTNLLSPRPRGWQEHLQSLARLGVFAACASALAHVMHGGFSPVWEQTVMVCSLAALYLLQVRREVWRQRAG